jgi:hypothetical protein
MADAIYKQGGWHADYAGCYLPAFGAAIGVQHDQKRTYRIQADF